MPEMDPQILLLSSLIQLETTARIRKQKLNWLLLWSTKPSAWSNTTRRSSARGGKPGRIKVTAVSGVDRPDRTSPYILYITRLLKRLSNLPDIRTRMLFLNPTSRKGKDQDGGNGLSDTRSGVLSSTKTVSGRGPPLHADRPLQEGETALLERLMDAYAHALDGPGEPRKKNGPPGPDPPSAAGDFRSSWRPLSSAPSSRP